MLLGVAAAALGLYVAARQASWLPTRYMLRRARAALRDRRECWVDPDDPDAVFADVVPRENWGKLMLETANDVGFLAVDGRRGELRFEGDRERYRVPAALLSCTTEEVALAPGGASELCVYYTVVRARLPDGVLEAPFARRGDLGGMDNNARRLRAKELRQRVLSLLDRA